MFELRWNPLLKWWVMVSDSRQKRPLLPKNQCPFCPGSGKVPDKYSVMTYNNDWPILKKNPPEPSSKNTKLYKTASSYGHCEVILYSSDHNMCFSKMGKAQVLKIIDLWIKRYKILSGEKHIKYVFIFENKGEEVGVTIHHPHGQIYGYPFIPKKLELELGASKEYNRKNGNCLHCDILKEEKKDGRRIVYKNKAFTAFVPFFAEYPYQVFIVSNRHIQSLADFRKEEKGFLADILRKITKAYDRVLDMPFPYMMCFHQQPVDGKKYDHYHFHIEFYPPMRNKHTQKYNASSETGAWAHGNPSSPEDKAKEIRKAIR